MLQTVQKFEEQDKVWLEGTETRPNMEVTITSASKNPITGIWQYTIQDNTDTSVSNHKSGDKWFPEADLSNSKD
jgi:hypothetical protein